MNNRYCLMALLLLVGGLAGCAADGSKSVESKSGDMPKSTELKIDDPKDGAAQFVVYRPSEYALSALSPTVEVNGVPTCDIASGGAFLREIQAGKVTVSLSHWHILGTSKLDFEAEQGKTYFIRVTANQEKAFVGVLGFAAVLIAEAASSSKGPYRMDLLDEALAEKDIQARGAPAVTICSIEAASPPAASDTPPSPKP